MNLFIAPGTTPECEFDVRNAPKQLMEFNAAFILFLYTFGRQFDAHLGYMLCGVLSNHGYLKNESCKRTLEVLFIFFFVITGFWTDFKMFRLAFYFLMRQIIFLVIALIKLAYFSE